MSGNNPFAALFNNGNSNSKKVAVDIDTILEDLFGFTLDESKAPNKIYLDSISKSFNRKDLDLQILQHALFDRLFLCNDEEFRRENTTIDNDNYYNESKVIRYLFKCYCQTYANHDLTENERNNVLSLIIKNAATALISLIQCEIYDGQELDVQLLDILKHEIDYRERFFEDVCAGILDDQDLDEHTFDKIIERITKLLIKECESVNLVTFDLKIFDVYKIITKDEKRAITFLNTSLDKIKAGMDYAHTAIGAILNISVLPKTPNAQYEYFQDPTLEVSVLSTEQMLWSNIDKLIQNLHIFIHGLLTSQQSIKNKTLEWFGCCLKANSDRRKLWNAQSPPELNPANYTTVSDGFMVNLLNLLLRLCQPFCANYKDKKMLKIDPTYCAVPNDKLEEKEIHLADLSTETFLVSPEHKQPPLAEKYNFITECFFLAHKTIDLGYQVASDKLVRLNNEVARMERNYRDAMGQAGGNSDEVSALKNGLVGKLSKYLSLKTQLTEPNLVDFLFNFISSSCYWLNQVAVHFDFNSDSTMLKCYSPLKEIPVQFPLSKEIPITLICIPEFIIENIANFLIFIRRFCIKVFEEQGFDKLSPILTFIIIYMGSPERIRNPHLRAKLAEGLEAILPYHNEESIPTNAMNTLGSYQREMLFSQHEHRSEIVVSLLSVFVDIEMTGQSVDFEQKFHYRRPMHVILEYLWAKDEHQQYIKALAEEAEKRIEDVKPPLFLRFVNLLLNDSVYLLDEALVNMSELREMEIARDNGDWEKLPIQERVQKMAYMRHIAMVAKFNNILGRDTINTLVKLTSKITIIFTHPTMVDRVAAMLNYFLFHLVGPKKKNFKVKNPAEYTFNPANTVLNICHIYVHLKESEAFCLAISQDGRSYSPQLFELAEKVLIRIGGGSLITELKELAIKVKEMALKQQANEEVLNGAPEHFFDPIMSTLMTDPVILPSSKQTVDRTTIARHLLSDQTDPFNRMPLSMDQVVPNTQLAEEIRNWLEAKKKQQS